MSDVETSWPDFDDVIDPDSVEIPGSRPRVQHSPRERERPVEKPWDAHSKVYRVNGENLELFDISALSRALNRKADTLKHWEARGWLPKTALRIPRKARGGHDVSPLTGHPIPGRRLYTRAFIEGIIALANKYSLVDTPGSSPEGTDFVDDVYDLYLRTMPGEPA